MHRFLPLILTAVFGTLACCQDVIDLSYGSAAGTYLRLKQLQTTGSVLHVVAHPDDEDGAMLTYFARGVGARTMLFAITRGEGGANLISSHFFDELGALRTLEHLKAASYYGNELFYSRGADYGYSKTLREAMTQWENGIPILEDLVEVIRRERPTVLISRFRGDPRDGHGHHQMAGVISRLAYAAAADPSQFPEQIRKGLSPWQVKKLYVTAGSPWRAPDEGEWTLAIPTGQIDPVLGRSYAQVARFGLGYQRSQGISGHLSDPGSRFSYYHLEQQFGTDPPNSSEESVFDGIQTGLSAILDQEHPLRPQLLAIEQGLSDVLATWNPQRRESTALQLIGLLKRCRGLQARLRRDREAASAALPILLHKERQLEQAIASALGLEIHAWATDLGDESFSHATPARKFASTGYSPIEATLFLSSSIPFA